jgi:hypothetical protein
MRTIMGISRFARNDKFLANVILVSGTKRRRISFCPAVFGVEAKNM